MKQWGSDSAVAKAHAGVLEAHRRSEKCHRTAAKIYRSYVHRLVGKTAVGQPEILPAAFMATVANAARWQAAVLTLTDSSGSERLVAASDATARRAHELEMTVAEGPSLEAMRVAVPVVRGELLESRWPRYGPIARDLGVQVVAATPLSLGSSPVGGSLTVLDTSPSGQAHQGGALGDLAEALTTIVVRAVERYAASDGGSAMEPFDPDDFQPELHQAAGVLSERRGWSISDSIALVRAHAFAEDRPVAAVATDVLRGELTL